jgi:hypothetical protein
MSLIPPNYDVYLSVSNTQSYIGNATVYARLNYVSLISTGTFGISLYFNQGSSSLVNIRGGGAGGTFSNAMTGGALTGQFDGQSTANNTFNTTNNFSSTLYGFISATVIANDDNPFAFGYVLTPTISFNFLLLTVNITQTFTVNTTTGYYMFILPEASTCIGQIFFVKNYGNTNYCMVSTSSSSQLIDGYSLNQVRLENGACIGLVAISSTQWSIITYLRNTGSIPTESISLTPTAITSNVVTVNVSAATKALSLPVPSSWGNGNFLMINSYNSNSGSANFYTQIYAQGRLANSASTGTTSMRMAISPDLSGTYDHNVSTLLLSDGNLWHMAGYFNGSGTYFDRNNNGLPGAGATTQGIVSHTSGGWVTTHSGFVVSESGRLYFTKMNSSTGNAYGIIVQNIGQAQTYGVVGYSSTLLAVTGSISGTTMTISPATTIPVGSFVDSPDGGIVVNTYVTAGSGTSYTVSVSQTVSSRTMYLTPGYGRVYKNASGNVSYSGFAMCQANVPIGGTSSTIHFPLTMYPSLY